MTNTAGRLAGDAIQVTGKSAPNGDPTDTMVACAPDGDSAVALWTYAAETTKDGGDVADGNLHVVPADNSVEAYWVPVDATVEAHSEGDGDNECTVPGGDPADATWPRAAEDTTNEGELKYIALYGDPQMT